MDYRITCEHSTVGIRNHVPCAWERIGADAWALRKVIEPRQVSCADAKRTGEYWLQAQGLTTRIELHHLAPGGMNVFATGPSLRA